jgi:PEGA domain
MTRRLLSYLAVAISSLALVAQQAPQVSTPASEAPATQSPPAVTSAAPAPQPPANILQDGTPMKLRLLSKLDSHTAKNGDQIPFDVINDVVVGGVTVLRRGSSVTGIVTQAEGSKTMGRAGRLSFTINDIQLGNGDKVPVRAFSRTSGENRTGEMIAYMLNAPIVAAPFFLLIHGTNTVFPRGTEINAFVNGDVSLDLASFLPAPPAEPATDLKPILQITSVPESAQVQIDGADAGSTPLNATVTVGKHEISIKKAGYSDWSKTLSVSGGATQVEAVLEALTPQ